MNKQAAGGLAIAGFVVLLISLIIPLYGLYIGGLALALVTVGAVFGERLFAVITVVLSGVKILFLSPSFQLMTHALSDTDDGPVMVWLVFILAHVVPVGALIWSARRETAGANASKPEG